MTQRIRLLGVPIDALTMDEALQRIREMLSSENQYHIATPNSEMLVEVTKNREFQSLLNKTDLNLPDSTGLLWMARATGQSLPERITGVDTVTELLRTMTEEHGIFLLGSASGIAEKAANVLRKRNSNLNIVGTASGSPRDEDADKIIEQINQAKPHILLVAYGAPLQDLWIGQYRNKLPSVRVAIGIGGTLDFIAGGKKRAPGWMRTIGLEWMWRLILEPQRIKRIWNAVVVFPLLVLRYGKD